MSEPGIGELVSRVLREAFELLTAEVGRARAEIDERARYGARLVLRTGITLMLLAVALQAFSVAAIVWSAGVFGGYIPGALVVGTAFLALAGVAGLTARRAALLLANPTRGALSARVDGHEPRAALPPSTSSSGSSSSERDQP